MNILQSYLNSFNQLSSAEIDLILSKYSFRELVPGEYFLKSGSVCDRLGFITEGVIRMFSLNGNGEEITTHFVAEGEFAVDIDSFNNQRESENYLQAITHCKVLCVSKISVDELLSSVPRLASVFYAISEIALVKKIKDQSIHHRRVAQEKYELFLENNPSIALRVPLQHIASFLNITPQSLSRIRKKAH